MGRTTGHYCHDHTETLPSGTTYHRQVAMRGLYMRVGNSFRSIGYVCPECFKVEINE
jgi:hypothetical protein